MTYYVDNRWYRDIPPCLSGVTLVVAAYNSLHPERADYQCNGVNDEIEINLAVNALTPGGKVVLLEGTFNISSPIVLVNNMTSLEGQGWGTFIDGDTLATGEHGIVISGVSQCQIRNLRMQTEGGGGKACHCVFIEDGANEFVIDNVYFVDSDSDAIHIEGSSIDQGWIRHCWVEMADGYGIYIDMDNLDMIDYIDIRDNQIFNCGADGIRVWTCASNQFINIIGNTISGSGAIGIYLYVGYYCVVVNNVVKTCAQWGIRIRECLNSTVIGNTLEENGADAIMLENSDYCMIENNNCLDSTAGTSDGIQVDGDSDYNTIIGNYCRANGRHGINVIGINNQVVGNFCYLNVTYGINAAGTYSQFTGNYCIESGEHGMYVGAECQVNDNYIYSSGQSSAGTYHGICVGSLGDRCQVNNNYIWDNGTNTEDGIYVSDGALYCQIQGNRITNLMGSGIMLAANNDDLVIQDNYIELCDDYGIEIGAATCNNNVVRENKLLGNGAGCISDGGTDTRLPFIYSPMPAPTGSIGNHPAVVLTDGADVSAMVSVFIPGEFQEFVRAHFFLVPGGTGNLRRQIDSDFGMICSESYKQNSDAAAIVQIAVTQNKIECIDASDAITDIAAFDLLGLEFTRWGTNVLDTVNADCYLIGFRLEYV